jgi:hypothetical protein
MKHEAIAESLNSSGNAPQGRKLAKGLTITEHEAAQVERANASERPTRCFSFTVSGCSRQAGTAG